MAAGVMEQVTQLCLMALPNGGLGLFVGEWTGGMEDWASSWAFALLRASSSPALSYDW